MTRRLRPPLRLEVRCRPDGVPLEIWRGGRRRAVTHVAASWVRPAPWWADHVEEGQSAAGSEPPLGERTYYRLVVQGPQVLEAFQDEERGWWLERVID